MGEIKNIAILGNGKMGTGIFNFLINFDFNIKWYGRHNSQKNENKYLRKLNRAIKNGLISEEEYKKKKQKCSFVSSVEELYDSDIVIETISEKLTEKKVLIKSVFSVISNEAIIASNSSSYIPSMLSDEKSEKRRIIGMHFFFPAEIKPIAELIVSSENSDNTIKTAMKFLENTGKKVFVQTEINAFVLNRLALVFQAEIFNFVKKTNIVFSDVDAVFKKYFSPTGIFETMDYIGLDIISESAKQYLKQEKNHDVFMPLINFIEKKTAKKETGVKKSYGFYKYPLTEDFFILKLNEKEENNIKNHIIKSFFKYYSVVKEQFKGEVELDFFVNEYFDTDINKWKKKLL